MDWWQRTFPKGRQTLVIEDAGGERVAIAYGEKGTGRPLILLHGIGSWSYSWRYCVEPLSQQFRVICVDAKGHGYSQSSFKGDSKGHQIIELERIVRSLTDEPAILVGESMGALIALAMVGNTPELCDRLVLINIPIFPKQLPSLGMRLLSAFPLDVVKLADQMQLVRPFAPLVREVTRIARREVVHDPSKITVEEIYWLTYPYVEFPGTITRFAADLQQAAEEINAYLKHNDGLIAQIQQRFDRVTCPTLILWGECDRWFPVEDGKQLQARLPNAQLQVIPNCGHNASGCSPDAVNEAILAFLS